MSVFDAELTAAIPRIIARLHERLERTEEPPAGDSVAILIDWATSLFAPERCRLIDRPSALTSWIVKQLIAGGLQDLRDACRELANDTALARSLDHRFERELTSLMERYEQDLVRRMEAQALSDRMEAMQRLTAGFAHELRNPVNAARLQLEVLERRTGQSMLSDDPAALSLFEIKSITELLDEFLLFARPAPLEIEDHDLVALVNQAVDDERAFAEEHDTALAVVTNVSTAPLSLDAPKIVFVVEELVHNAVESVGDHGHVDVEVDMRVDAVRIAVRDDGTGIATDLQHRIYEPFFSTRDHGRGLGLAIVHTFVTLHGGRIEVGSNAQGTCFVVTLPRVDAR
ncbi:MAG: HAMP domain-containing histidine kinase [Myxococcota bacterium]|nr:HAMP domain-containing histidine kinase [Deltaproteobacteria bacterium]MDQ3336394.1 HAMP domain-containing histidine kinase [Myxococcota bacterium]